MSQKASTRIPTFGSRIPLPGSNNPKETFSQVHTLSRSDLGRRVRISGEKEGILRFAGEVHFASGIWCGVEVQRGAGKNDGQVRGIRYFSCPSSCGLMVPSSKITIVEDVIEDPSGPYSILFGIEDGLSKINPCDVTFLKNNNLGNNTFTKSDEDLQIKEEELNKTITKENFILENLVGYNCYNNHGLKDFEGSPRKTRLSPEDDPNKRDSLDFDESLGILTPDQMIDVSALVGSRTPSSENIRLLPHDEQSQADFSLGLISAQTMKTDEINLSLDLKDITITRIEQTPSPEELPLDPTPIQKAETNKSTKPSNSFITSITSITSLDTGYQGDGEMSRPGSRGADTSPLTRRPQQRTPPRRADPMTDSDFYTESDADNHEEHPLRGDRHAQVIDGTLYGVDPQAAADIYVNNRENMDSSGIFTDIERESSSDNKNQNFELSPTDSSTKTISDDSQNPNNTYLTEPLIIKTEERPSTPASVSTVASSPGYTKSPRLVPNSKEECNSANKKHKMPKRNVASKVKAMIEPNNKENEKKIEQSKKAPGRWDAVLTRISSPQDAKKLKEVKSKVFSGIPSCVNRNKENVKKTAGTTKMIRRVRTRTSPQTTAGSKNLESIGSSLSDLSGASSAKNSGSAKKQRDVVRVAQVLTTAKLSPKPSAHSTVTEAKNKTNTNLNNELKPAGRLLFNAKDNRKKEPSPKDIGKSAVKGGRVLPGTRPLQPLPVAVQPEKQSHRTVEALAVLVHHLVFNLEAFKNPALKKEAERMRLDAEEAHLSCLQLEETLSDEKRRHVDIIQDERNKYRAEITQLIEKHRNEIIKLNHQQQESQKHLEMERDSIASNMTENHEDHLRKIKIEFEKFKKKHEESLDILREENDMIMEQIDEKNACINRLRTKESNLQAQLQSALQENAQFLAGRESEVPMIDFDNTAAEAHSLRAVLDLKLQEIAELRKALAEVSQKAEHLPAAEEKIAVLVAKCEDFEAQLKRKSECEFQLVNENKKLNETIKEEINQKKRMHLHNEELQWKLQQNKEVMTIVLEGAEANSTFNRSMLSASFNERHNSCNKSGFERTLSFRERSLSNKSNSSECSRKCKNSFDLDFDDLSPPDSPKVKGVVEKSDSVSYVLEMDEKPEVVASRIVRRSFRHATPPKNTPTKSPANKRPRMKNNLTLSVSSSSIAVKSDCPKSARSEGSDDILFWDVSASTPNTTQDSYWSTNTDYDDEDDIKIPTLPSEIGRKHANTLPVPKHLAGEAMISESNSEDESSTSSSSGQLLL